MASQLPCQLQARADGWQLLGDMTFATVPALLAQSRRQFDFGQSLRIDLAQVVHADSAGLALLLEWLGQARAAQGQIQFAHVPEALRNIARLCNVDSLLHTDI